MAFQNSDLTLADMQQWLEFQLKVGSIRDNDIIYAANDFYSIFQRLERQTYPDRYLQTTGAIDPSGGYDLTNITDLGSDTEGFVVYDISKNPDAVIPKTNENVDTPGYYIRNNTLYLTQYYKNIPNIKIQYITQTRRVALGADLSTELLGIDRDAEQLMRRYLQYNFFEGRYQPNLAADNQQKFYQEAQRFFEAPSKVFYLYNFGPNNQSWR